MRVLKRDQSGRRNVISTIVVNCAGDFIPSENSTAIVAFHGTRQRTGERGHRGHFEIVNVAALFDDHFLPGPRVQFDRRLVSHGTGRHKKRCVFLKDFSRALLQTVDRRIFAVNVVADLGFGHSTPHRGRWFGNSIAA